MFAQGHAGGGPHSRYCEEVVSASSARCDRQPEITNDLHAVKPLLRRHAQVSKRVGKVWVGAHLQYDSAWTEVSYDLGDDSFECVHPNIARCKRLQGDIDTVGFGRPNFAGESRSGVERLARFVNADGEHRGIVAKNLLYSVSMMEIDVYIRYAFEPFEKNSDHDRGVVVDAES